MKAAKPAPGPKPITKPNAIKGHNHASALRCLGKRWLKLLWRMWQTREPYDETKHNKNLERHGSPVWQQIKPAIPVAGE